MLPATSFTGLTLQTDATQHSFSPFPFLALTKHVLIIARWVINKLADILIAIVRIGEGLV